ncbi:LIM domain-containing protein [Thermopirellula anaerolimosa]
MTADQCARCGKPFLWYWRWRYSCDHCKVSVCSSCLSTNIEGRNVCNQCHVCSLCRSRVAKQTLTAVRSRLLCSRCYNGFLQRLNNWIPGTKRETLQGCVITRRLGLIRVYDKCEDPAEVANILKFEVALAGGNSYVEFFWDKHIKHHEEEYIAGYGAKGNPYYRTRRWTTQYFTGHAVAVCANRRGGKF